MLELDIRGMTCNHCVHAVTEALRQVPGVASVHVSLKPGKARVEGTATVEALKAAVAEEGYQAHASQPGT